jgi:N6-adenosine-specific RNA methylase IME4
MTQFQTVLADPAWDYGDKLKAMKSSGSGAASHYSCMSLDEIRDLAGVDPLGQTPGLHIAGYPIADDAHLWLWVTNPFLVNEPWQSVVKAWGFVPKTLVTWVKGRIAVYPNSLSADLVLHVGQGRYTRGCTEHLVLATRGKAAGLVQAHSVPNVFIAPRTRHSEKPEESYRIIERVSPGPRLELFARRKREGWTAWGNEVAA